MSLLDKLKSSFSKKEPEATDEERETLVDAEGGGDASMLAEPKTKWWKRRPSCRLSGKAITWLVVLMVVAGVVIGVSLAPNKGPGTAAFALPVFVDPYHIRQSFVDDPVVIASTEYDADAAATAYGGAASIERILFDDMDPEMRLAVRERVVALDAAAHPDRLTTPYDDAFEVNAAATVQEAFAPAYANLCYLMSFNMKDHINKGPFRPDPNAWIAKMKALPAGHPCRVTVERMNSYQRTELRYLHPEMTVTSDGVGDRIPNTITVWSEVDYLGLNRVITEYVFNGKISPATPFGSFEMRKTMYNPDAHCDPGSWPGVNRVYHMEGGHYVFRYIKQGCTARGEVGARDQSAYVVHTDGKSGHGISFTGLFDTWGGAAFQGSLEIQVSGKASKAAVIATKEPRDSSLAGCWDRSSPIYRFENPRYQIFDATTGNRAWARTRILMNLKRHGSLIGDSEIEAATLHIGAGAKPGTKKYTPPATFFSVDRGDPLLGPDDQITVTGDATEKTCTTYGGCFKAATSFTVTKGSVPVPLLPGPLTFTTKYDHPRPDSVTVGSSGTMTVEESTVDLPAWRADGCGLELCMAQYMPADGTTVGPTGKEFKLKLSAARVLHMPPGKESDCGTIHYQDPGVKFLTKVVPATRPPVPH